jgi:hypothetical protein
MLYREAVTMTNTDDRQHRSILQRIARRVMMERWQVRCGNGIGVKNT